MLKKHHLLIKVLKSKILIQIKVNIIKIIELIKLKEEKFRVKENIILQQIYLIILIIIILKEKQQEVPVEILIMD